MGTKHVSLDVFNSQYIFLSGEASMITRLTYTKQVEPFVAALKK